MSALALFLMAAALAHGLARWLRLPTIPMLLLAGLAVGQLAVVELPAEFLQGTLELGLLFLVFSAGVELNPRRVAGRTRGVVLVACGQFLVLGGLGFLVGRALGYPPQTALYLAFALSASSTLVVVGNLKQRQQMFEPFGRLVTGVLLLQDVMIIVGMIVLIRLPDGLEAIGVGLGLLALLGGVAWLSHRWLLPWLVIRLKLDDETRLLSIISVLFAFTGLAWLLNLPLLAGAFLAGYTLSSFPVNGLVRGILLSLNDFFLALFFLALGALINLPDPWILIQVLVLGALVVGVTVPLVAALAERCGFSARASIESGLLLSQTSEFSLIIALQGWAAGQLAPEMFSLIALLTVTLMTATPYLATDQNTWRLMRLHPMRRRPAPPRAEGGHVLLLGFGSTGEALLRALEGSSREIVVVDDDAAVIQRLQGRGISCFRGDGSDAHTLRQLNARRAAGIVSSVRRQSDTEQILHYLRGSDVPLVTRVPDEKTAERLRELGGSPVVMIEPTLDLFMLWIKENQI